MSYLSPSQLKALEQRRVGKRHAMDRLIERHFPTMNDDDAENLIDAMTKLCQLRHQLGDTKTARLVNIETSSSHVVDLDMFEDRGLIRVTFDPMVGRIATVFPKGKST